jgi:hypothetical protein
MSSISAGTTSGTALVSSGDTTWLADIEIQIGQLRQQLAGVSNGQNT